MCDSTWLWFKTTSALVINGCSWILHGVGGTYLYKYLPQHIKKVGTFYFKNNYTEKNGGGDSIKHSIKLLSPYPIKECHMFGDLIFNLKSLHSFLHWYHNTFSSDTLPPTKN